VIHKPPPRPPIEHRAVARPERLPERPPPEPRYAPPMQTAALPPMPQPAPVAAPSPTISAGYRSALSAWLESHKQYPQNARERGEQGRVTLRFRVARNGRVLSHAVAGSSGYPDLDAAVDTMMRGATMPPFPTDMTTPEIEVTVTVRFALTR
jgi:protein TonB